MLAQNQATALAAVQQKLEQREPALSPTPHYNGQLPASFTPDVPPVETESAAAQED
jgi:hypothetical protein